MKAIATNTGLRELKWTLVLWGALMLLAMAAFWALHANALRVINRIEYVEAGRFQRMTALYLEAETRTAAVLEKANALNKESNQKVLVPATDPDYLAAVSLYNRAMALDPRPEYAPDRRRHYEQFAQLHEVVGAEASEVRLLAKAYLSTGNAKDAQTYANALLGRNQKDTEAWKLLLESRIMAQDSNAATAALSRMETAGVPMYLVHYYRSRVAQSRDEGTTAVVEMEKALAALPGEGEPQPTPNELDLRKQLGLLLAAADNYAQAADVLKPGLDKGGNQDPEYLHQYGNALVKTKRSNEAIRILERAVSFERNSASLYWSLAQAYESDGKAGLSNEAMQQALKLDPTMQKKVLSGKVD